MNDPIETTIRATWNEAATYQPQPILSMIGSALRRWWKGRK